MIFSWVLIACACRYLAGPCRAQIINVTDDQSTPIPGAGHNYIHLLTETVNPANGSLSVRIQLPVPKSLGITIPFAIAYDSNGVTYPSGTTAGVMYWAKGDSDLASGGWSYAVPRLDMQVASVYDPGTGLDECDYYVDYLFTGPSGGRHALRLSSWDLASQNCQEYGPPQRLTGGDDLYRASIAAGGTDVADADGTVYNFGASSLPTSVEDRNGNQATFSWTNWGAKAFSETDTATRTAVATSSFAASGGDTIAVSGLSSPYHVYWSSVGYSYNAGWSQVGNNDGGCASFLLDSGTHNVVSSITLPNGQVYHFYYDPNNGLLDEIVYPTGGWVKYTWSTNSASESVTLYDTYGNAGSCQYQYGTPAIVKRQVSFDGTSVALEQDFGPYVTTWNQNNPLAWASKSTTVAQSLTGGANSQTVYAYSPIATPAQPNDNYSYSDPLYVPVESQILYKNATGSTLRTVNKTWQDQYLLLSQQTVLENGASSQISYTYDNNSQLTKKVETNYDGSTRTTNITYATGLTDPLGFSIVDRPASVAISGASSAETDYSYDSHGNAKTKTRKCLNGCPGGAGDLTTQYTYNSDGQLATMKGPNGATTSYTYTCSDTYPSQIQYPSWNGVAHVENFTYDCSSGELTGSTDENGQTASYAYNDSLNRLTETDYPDGGKTTDTYNDTPPVSVTTRKLLLSGAWANPSTSTMDGMGHVVKIVGENGAETDMTYDGEGALYTKTNPGDPGHYITYNHDALGRLTSTTYQDGSTATVAYSGNCATTTDPAGKTNETCSDALGRITSDADASGTTTYTYDALDNLTSVTQGVQSRTFNYNSLSELYSETNPESGTTTYAYDAPTSSCTNSSWNPWDPGNLVQKQEADGNVTCYLHDALGRLGGTYVAAGPAWWGITGCTSFEYDNSTGYLGQGPPAGVSITNPVGRLVEALRTDCNWPPSPSDIHTDEWFGYDAMGRTLTKYAAVGTTAGTAAYSYNLDGTVNTLTYPRSGRTLAYTVNSAEQETQLSDQAGQINYVGPGAATYSPAGGLATMANGNGAAFSETYDARLRPSAITAAVNGANILNLAYTYDGDNNVTQLAQTGVTNETYTETFGYDNLNRILSGSSTTGWTQDFGYNGDGSGGRYGNVTCTSAGGPPCAQLTFNQQTNRITMIGTQTPTYGAAGEMTSDGTGTGTTQYTWNGEGKPMTVTPWGGATTTYVYDAEGRRVEDTAANRLFWYGASGKLLETTDAGTTNHDYIYFDGRRIARYDSSGAVYYLYDDANGSLRTATDAGGTQLCWADYYPFGEPAAGTGCSLDNYQFAGLYTDAAGEDGAYSAAQRRYNDTYYRWFSPDPDNAGADVGDSQSWDMYSYVGDNPVSRTDPSGESYCEKDSNGNIDLSTCVSDKAYQSLKNTKGYLHVSQDVSLTVNGSEATQQDYMFALGAGVQMAAPVVNATGVGLGAFATIIAPETLVEEAPASLGLEGQPAIGKMADLTSELGAGERELALPDQGEPQANWYQNSRRLRQEMREDRPIKDATALKYGGPDKMNTGYLRMERNLLKNRGWTYNNGYWYPPGR
jgi:RHS repeat-associated protein